ncbi:MAG: hypothetical protein Q9166_006253 [cf. Caloplaca sp. 2 TL-2023]
MKYEACRETAVLNSYDDDLGLHLPQSSSPESPTGCRPSKESMVVDSRREDSQEQHLNMVSLDGLFTLIDIESREEPSSVGKNRQGEDLVQFFAGLMEKGRRLDTVAMTPREEPSQVGTKQQHEELSQFVTGLIEKGRHSNMTATTPHVLQETPELGDHTLPDNEEWCDLEEEAKASTEDEESIDDSTFKIGKSFQKVGGDASSIDISGSSTLVTSLPARSTSVTGKADVDFPAHPLNHSSIQTEEDNPLRFTLLECVFRLQEIDESLEASGAWSSTNDQTSLDEHKQLNEDLCIAIRLAISLATLPANDEFLNRTLPRFRAQLRYISQVLTDFVHTKDTVADKVRISTLTRWYTKLERLEKELQF